MRSLALGSEVDKVIASGLWQVVGVVIIIIIIFFFFFLLLHGLGRLTCSSIDVLPSFPGASTISSSSGFVVEGVVPESGVVQSFKVVDPVLFVFGSYILYSRDLRFVCYDFAVFCTALLRVQ